MHSTINSLRKELSDANFNEKQPEVNLIKLFFKQLEKELDKLLSNFKSLSEKIQKSISIKQEINQVHPPITKAEIQNKIHHKMCLKEEKIVKDLFINLKPDRINEFYDANKNYQYCLQSAKKHNK